MRKINIITGLVLSLVVLLGTAPVMAATNDFTADGDITVTGVNLGATTVDLLILSGSTSESWNFSSGTMTVTNPGSTFKVGSSDSSVLSIRAVVGSTIKDCANNTQPGTSYLTIPTPSETYTIEPSSVNCTGGGGSSSGGGGGGGGSSSTQTSTVTTPATQTTTTVTEPISSPSNVSSTPGVPAKDSKGNITLEQILADANIIMTGNVNDVASEMGLVRNVALETANKATIDKVIGSANITDEVLNNIKEFINYGTKSTKILGSGERAGVVNSFKSAFGKLPTTESDWSDIVKIANGRWPSQKSVDSEKNAAEAFKKIYLRNPDMNNRNDNAAVTVIAYGLRPANRNLNSEKQAIKSFKAIYGYAPVTATAWDIVRAIAYSGAKR